MSGTSLKKEKKSDTETTLYKFHSQPTTVIFAHWINLAFVICISIRRELEEWCLNGDEGGGGEGCGQHHEERDGGRDAGVLQPQDVPPEQAFKLGILKPGQDKPYCWPQMTRGEWVGWMTGIWQISHETFTLTLIYTYMTIVLNSPSYVTLFLSYNFRICKSSYKFLFTNHLQALKSRGDHPH